MKVLEVHSGNATGGDSTRYTFVREQGESLEKQGCIVDYFAIVGKGLGGYLKNVSKLRSKIEEFRPDIVHAHYGLCGMVAVLATFGLSHLFLLKLARKTCRPKVVTTFHNGETLNWKVNLLCSLFSMQADYVVYVAQHIYDKSIFKAKSYAIIPCGVTMEDMVITPYEEARKQLGWNQNNKKYILFGGSISNQRKNYALLEAALNRIGKKSMDSNVWVISGNSFFEEIEVVEMRGFTREQCVLRMCACDCFCLPSLSEGSPQALKEAIALNCPAVATDMADIRQLFGTEGGYYISDFTAESMTECLIKCLSFGERTSGRERILELGLRNEDVARKLKSIYDSILVYQ